MLNIKRIFYNWYYQKFPPEMVRYWKTKDAARAKVTKAKDGSYHMIIEGEKYPFPGFPRGNVLLQSVGYAPLSVMKHRIKNEIFNDAWARLQKGEDIVEKIKTEGLDMIAKQVDIVKYDMFPPEKMNSSAREIYRAFTVVSEDKRVCTLRDCLTFILQEDDGYRFRVQWAFKFFPIIKFFARGKYIEKFLYALSMMEHAEVVGDMKERIVLLRTVLKEVLKDKTISTLFNKLFEEIDWKKVRLTKADKYYFRAKYYKVDFPEYEY